MESSQRKPVKRKQQILDLSDSDEDANKNTTRSCDSKRQSTRIQNRRHKPEFKLPTRDDVWNNIPSAKSPIKLKKLTPRKTVNNFTKVYNDYNFDDYDDDTSNDEDSAAETSESDSGEGKKTQHRIKNYHKRIKVDSSSSSEEDNTNDKNTTAQAKDEDTEDKMSKKPEMADDAKNPVDDIPAENIDESDSDSNEIISPRKKNIRNASVLESDDSESNDTAESHEDKTDESSDSESLLECRSAKLKSKQQEMFQKLRDAQANRKKRLSNT